MFELHSNWGLKFHLRMRNFATARWRNFAKIIFVFSGSQTTIPEILELFEPFLIENEFFERKIHFKNPY
jgi:hypothetical protein